VGTTASFEVDEDAERAFKLSRSAAARLINDIQTWQGEAARAKKLCDHHAFGRTRFCFHERRGYRWVARRNRSLRDERHDNQSGSQTLASRESNSRP